MHCRNVEFTNLMLEGVWLRERARLHEREIYQHLMIGEKPVVNTTHGLWQLLV